MIKSEIGPKSPKTSKNQPHPPLPPTLAQPHSRQISRTPSPLHSVDRKVLKLVKTNPLPHQISPNAIPASLGGPKSPKTNKNRLHPRPPRRLQTAAAWVLARPSINKALATRIFLHFQLTGLTRPGEPPDFFFKKLVFSVLVSCYFWCFKHLYTLPINSSPWTLRMCLAIRSRLKLFSQ